MCSSASSIRSEYFKFRSNSSSGFKLWTKFYQWKWPAFFIIFLSIYMWALHSPDKFDVIDKREEKKNVRWHWFKNPYEIWMYVPLECFIRMLNVWASVYGDRVTSCPLKKTIVYKNFMLIFFCYISLVIFAVLKFSLATQTNKTTNFGSCDNNNNDWIRHTTHQHNRTVCIA